jgi:hypothetical protein
MPFMPDGFLQGPRMSEVTALGAPKGCMYGPKRRKRFWPRMCAEAACLGGLHSMSLTEAGRQRLK